MRCSAARGQRAATLAESVAHELGSLLFAASIQLHRDVGADAPDDRTAHASALVGQAQALAAALLDLYTSPETVNPRALSLGAWLPQTVARISVAVPRAIVVSTEVAPGTPPVVACPLGLEHVVRTLIVNGAEAIGERGHVRVSAGPAPPEHGPLVEIRVRDDGHGVPEAARGRLFEPGYSTRGGVRRRGMGLAIAARALEQCGGTIAHEHNEPRGSTFVIRLRAASEGEA